MAHPWDIVAWVAEGEIYCENCPPEGVDSRPDDETSPIFLDNDDGIYGATCGRCHACYGPDGWELENNWRWATCEACNHQRPYRRNDSRARLESWQGRLACPCCHRGRLRFLPSRNRRPRGVVLELASHRAYRPVKQPE